jgi:uroporphyrin-III C-methyltransferase
VSVWLIGACDPNQLSSIALHALRTADAVIHDPDVSVEILYLVRPSRYREAALPTEAIQRTVKLARDGWRVVRVVERDPLARNHAIECAAKFSDYGIPFRFISIASEPSISGVPI